MLVADAKIRRIEIRVCGYSFLQNQLFLNELMFEVEKHRWKR